MLYSIQNLRFSSDSKGNCRNSLNAVPLIHTCSEKSVLSGHDSYMIVHYTTASQACKAEVCASESRHKVNFIVI